MDNSPANFSFVEFNDYFGAEEDSKEEMKKQAMDEWYETFGDFYTTDQLDLIITERFYGYQDDEDITRELYNDINTFEQTENEALIIQRFRNGKPKTYSWFTKEYPEFGAETFEAGDVGIDDINCPDCGYPGLSIIGRVQCSNCDGTFYDAETHEDDTFICQRSGKTEHMDNGFLVPNLGMVSEDHMTKEDWRAWDKHNARFNPDSYSQEQLKELGLVKEAPYAGAGSLFSIGQNTGLEGFTTSELTTSSAIHGDFDEASLNYSGHQNFEVRAEMEMIDDSNARIRNRFNDEIGMVSVDDHDVEDAVVEVSDGSDVIQEVIVSESDTVKKSLLPLALGALAAVVAFPQSLHSLPKSKKKRRKLPN